MSQMNSNEAAEAFESRCDGLGLVREPHDEFLLLIVQLLLLFLVRRVAICLLQLVI